MNIALVYVCDESGVIADSQGRRLWHQEADLKHYMDLTVGNLVIMGRKTYESIGHALPDRENVIITRQKDYKAPGCRVISSVEEALSLEGHDKLFIIGGAEIYRQFENYASEIYQTILHTHTNGDIVFNYDKNDWRIDETEFHEHDEKNDYDYTFLHLIKKVS